MNKSKFVFSVIVISLICLMSFSNSFAQTKNQQQIEPGYEIVLHILSGSNDPRISEEVPAKLSRVVKNIQENSSFKNYELLSIFFGRVGESGGISQRVFKKGLGKDKDDLAIFQWKLDDLRSLQDTGDKNLIQFRTFDFTANILVQRTIVNSDGQEKVIKTGDPISLSVGRFSVPESEPTLIGTLETPFEGKTIFFVLSVKPFK
jgi:hypothetical protein